MHPPVISQKGRQGPSHLWLCGDRQQQHAPTERREGGEPTDISTPNEEGGGWNGFSVIFTARGGRGGAVAAAEARNLRRLE